MADTDPFLTRRQVADHMAVSERTVARLVDEGQLPASRIRGQYRFRTSDIQTFLDAARIEPTPLDAA